MKDSFVLYTKYGKHIQKLDMEQRGVLFTAILNYMEEKDIPEMEPATDMIFGIIKEDIDECNAKWEKTRKARAEAGREGGNAKAAKSKQTVANVANASIAKQNEANVAVNVNVNDNVIEKESIKKKKANTSALQKEFEALWELYPRKNGKKYAFKHYQTARNSGTTFEEVQAGIEAYKRYIDKTGVEPQYIKMGSSFFCQRSWGDDWSIPHARAKPKSNVYQPEPPKYKELLPDPEVETSQMPAEIREKLRNLF